VITIRKFEPNDTFPVIKLASETLPETYNPALFNYFYETYPEGFLVAELHHKIIGFLVGVKTQPNIVRIPMLSVNETYQRQGIGSTLLNQFQKEMQLQNIKLIELEVRTDNIKAISFYKKHNFKIIETIPKFYQNGEDAYLFRRMF